MNNQQQHSPISDDLTLAELEAELARLETLSAFAPHTPDIPPIRAEPRQEDPPLSFAQQRLWFIDQFDPHTAAYNIPLAVGIAGPLDIGMLRRSLRAIVRRHESLRTTFPSKDGRPRQVIAPDARPAPPLIDLRRLPEAQRERVVRRLATAEAQRPFDLARGPLLRFVLLRLKRESHVALLTMHHIISDGWSLGVFVSELAALYEAFGDARPDPLEPLPVQYADFAIWQRRWLTDQALDAQLGYWKRQLAGDPPALDLPFDRPRPTYLTFQGAQHPIAISRDLSAALRALSRGEDATLFMALLAAFQALLGRYANQTDVLVGSPIANRSQPELEGLIGFFVNTLALRGDLSGDPSFRALIGRVRQVCLDAYAHQDLPFEQLVEAIQPERQSGRQPLFQALFALQNTPRQAFTFSRLTMRSLEVHSGTAKFDLVLAMDDSDPAIAGSFEYNTDLFDAPTIARMAGHFRRMLEAAVADPDQRLSRMALLSASERHQLLAEWNETGAAYPREGCVHELFEAQAARTPDAVALIFDTTTNAEAPFDEGRRAKDERGPSSFVVRRSSRAQLTYAALNARANQLAHRLRALGAGPETVVALGLERGPALLLALLAVLKAGSAYLPLDLGHPPARIAYMLEDSQARLLVTNDGALRATSQGDERSFGLDRAPIVDLAADWPLIAREPATNPAGGATAANLAYVLFTSGSTGAPKAVAMAHRALRNLLAWQADALARPRAARTLQFAAFTFDASFQEIFSTWSVGGALAPAPEGIRSDAAALAAFIDEQRIERAFLPVVVLQHLANVLADAPRPPAALRELMIAGEALQITPPIVRLFQRLPHAALHNHYGPTETHVATAYTLPADRATWPARPSIGRPIGNGSAYVLDAWMRPAPIGVVGELYLGGALLARGYLRRPDLTAAAFLPNPFTLGSGVRGLGSGVWGSGADPEPRTPNLEPRLYRTGDLARFRPDGALLFLGRRDGQIKLRGFRIELGEVEAALRQHPAIALAAALVREGPGASVQLVAYVVTSNELRVPSSNPPNARDAASSFAAEPPTDTAELSSFVPSLRSGQALRPSSLGADSSLAARHSSLVSELRAFLRGRLPEYMVPALIEIRDSLPLSRTGKIDRRALAEDARQQDPQAPSVAPRNELEAQVAAIWSEVLGRATLSVDDDFFALGGHSLLATQVIARLRARFQLDLTVRDLFRDPTVAGLAEAIAALQWAAQAGPPAASHDTEREEFEL